MMSVMSVMLGVEGYSLTVEFCVSEAGLVMFYRGGAETTAAVLVNFRVYSITSSIPTPFIAFAVEVK